MDFPNYLILPTSESKKMKFLKELKMKRLQTLKKELEGKETMVASDTARNKVVYSQELNHLNNEMKNIERLLSKGSSRLSLYIIEKIIERQEQFKKIIST